LNSIVNEVSELASQGVKEIVLLGQNVNSYHDKSPASIEKYPDGKCTLSSSKFKNMYRSRDGAGAR
jgi:tRNA A37 methylthiotransferase MiaB